MSPFLPFLTKDNDELKTQKMLDKLRNKIKLWFRQSRRKIAAKLELTLLLTESLKRLMSSKQGDALAMLLPEKLASKKAQFLVAIDSAIASLDEAKECMNQSSTEDKLLCFLAATRLRTTDEQQLLLKTLAGLIAKHLEE